MAISHLKKPEYIFTTEGGEIRFQEDKKYFIFYNPKTLAKPEDTKDRCETICLPMTLSHLLKYLPRAKKVAQEYNDLVDNAPPEEAENLKLEEGEIYTQVLTSFAGKSPSPAIRHVLQVSMFNGKAYIWLKRFFQADDGEYKACRGGYWFGQNDDEKAIMEYANKCISFTDFQRKLLKARALERRMTVKSKERKEDDGEMNEGMSYSKMSKLSIQ